MVFTHKIHESQYPMNNNGITLADPGGGGSGGWNPPLFWPINAFELGHIAGTLPLSWVGTPSFLKWLDPPLNPQYLVDTCIISRLHTTFLNVQHSNSILD